MTIRTRLLPALLLACFLLMALPGVGLAQDTTPPNITAFTFTPASINTGASSADVTVNFTVADDAGGSGFLYLETAFVDPSGGFFRRASKFYASHPASVTDSVVINFPQFSPAGTWKLAFLFLADADGNTLVLDTAGIASRGFATDLTVSSAVDNTPPDISAFTFNTPINTTSADATVTVNFTVSDNLAGVVSVYSGFVSPSGTTRGTRVCATGFAANTPGCPNPAGDFTAGTTVTSSLAINFPKLSEPGAWKVSFINVVDGAGNTIFLDTAAVLAKGFPTNLTVTSTPDTTQPNLTAFSFAPSTITTAGGPVTVNFTVTDDLSGANTFQVAFVSPSGAQVVNGAASFPAATTVSSSLMVNFPPGTEEGTWNLASIFIADVAGNTRLINQTISLPVTPAAADTTPPVISPSLNPLPNGQGWNNSDVTLMWTVTDPESAITAMSGCGPTTETTSVVRTCSATSTGGTNAVPVTINIDKIAPVTSNVVATPSPKPATSVKTITGAANNGSGLIRITATGHGFATGNYVTITGVTGTTEANGLFPITVITADTFDLVGSTFANPYISGGLASVPLVISATVTDSGGSNVASAEYNIDGGAFDDLDATDGSFGGASENVRVALPVTHPVLIAGGNHTFCVRGTDTAENVGAAACVTVNITPHTPPPGEQFGFFVGLRNSDDLGTNFDLQVEVLKNSVVVATGLTRCVEDVVRNANQAKEVSVVLPALTGVNTGDVLLFRISTRIGTNPDDTKCDGHNNATGLRLYYDSTTQPSLVQAEVNGAPLANFFLHTTGSSDFFDTTTPAGTTAKTKDSASVNFSGGNLFKVIGTWSRTQP